MIRLLYILFVLSGAAGLFYESVWTRYLGLFVGHDAYAQIVVLVIFLGGMSLGAMLVSRYSERLTEPLQGYAAIELVVGLIGLFFHEIYGAVTGVAYASLFPALAGGAALGLAKWGLASALILPQSILLGATFPLMSAGVLRLAPANPGRSLSLLYFANSLGAAAGVLIAGFWLARLAGLPGTLLAAGMLNLVVAAVTMFVVVAARRRGLEQRPTPAATAAAPTAAAPVGGRLRALLLGTAFGTAVASFIYEIDWIRMLSLVLGSATHSFELMLSAFILGLALGAFWIRSRADRLKSPLRTLGLVQWVMGLLALATLPVYAESFEWLAGLMRTFGRTEEGYTGFMLSRYAICLAVMLPATFCAGMTLPLLTRTLLTSGEGERAIGAVYAWNTLGSIVGVIIGGLVLLPLLGLKGMLVVGAVLDIGIGVMLLREAERRQPALRPLAWAAAALAVVAAGGIWMSARLEQHVLVSGVFRRGVIAQPGEWDVRFYRDGRTATVSGVRLASDSSLSLATNGKADASLRNIWLQPCDSMRELVPLSGDEGTQILLPLIAAAHAPRARVGAVIGHGSGMSSHLLLSSPALQRLVTVEIEPEMIAGSRIFHPANRRVFEDPRSMLVVDDAKSYFAASRQRYDLILSEPSNPWVSGVSGLFTVEFYERIKGYLSEGGVFGQWLQLYELDDELALSVLAAVHRVFPSYQIYLVPGADLLVLASNQPLPEPDWSVAALPAIQTDLCRFRPLTPEALSALRLADRTTLGPLLAEWQQPNSDYYPILDLGAERRRFLKSVAAGFTGLSNDWFNLTASIEGRRVGPSTEPVPALPDNPRGSARALGAYLRNAAADRAAPSKRPLERQAIYRLQQWRSLMESGQPPADWTLWVQQAGQAAVDRQGGTAGWVDEELRREMLAYLDRHNAPATARDVIAFRSAIAGWDFPAAAAAADRLLPVIIREHDWMAADEFRDGAVIAKLQVRDTRGARQVFDTLARFSMRKPSNVRSQLLHTYVRAAEGRQTNMVTH